MKRRTFLQATAGAALLPGTLFAQDKYPSKPITWICPRTALAAVQTAARARSAN